MVKMEYRLDITKNMIKIQKLLYKFHNKMLNHVALMCLE